MSSIDTDTLMAPKAADFKTPLQRWLWANRKTQRWLADACGVHFSLISLVTTGARTPSDDLKKRLRKVTGLKRI